MMKTIRRGLLPLLFILSIVKVFAQVEEPSEKMSEKNKNTEQSIQLDKHDVKKVSVDEYYTERDYNSKFNTKKNKKSKNKVEELYEVDEYGNVIREDYQGKDQKRLNNRRVGVVLEVAFNVAFIALSFWQ